MEKMLLIEINEFQPCLEFIQRSNLPGIILPGSEYFEKYYFYSSSLLSTGVKPSGTADSDGS